MLDVRIFDAAGKLITLFTDDPESYEVDTTDEDLDIEVEHAVDYVSTINAGSYGPPALVAPVPGRDPAARTARSEVDETVLYINTSLVPIYAITRVSD